MSTAEVGTDKRTALEPRQCLVLRNIDWATYRKVSDALTGHHVRLTYDRGVLELMTKSTLHELLSRFYYRLLVVLTEEFGLPLASCGSMTCDRDDLKRGAEPDECFYLGNALSVRGKDQIDLAVDPPPDLMVEIDLSRSSLRRLAIYATLKVPEVWQVDADSLTVLRLGQDGEYSVADESKYFPGIPLAKVGAFVQRRHVPGDSLLGARLPGTERQGDALIGRGRLTSS
jgi:Uma2 family endonuclease